MCESESGMHSLTRVGLPCGARFSVQRRTSVRRRRSRTTRPVRLPAEAVSGTLKRAPQGCTLFPGALHFGAHGGRNVWLAAMICCGQMLAGGTFSFHVMGDDAGAWPAALSSVGLVGNASAGAGVVVAPAGTSAPISEWAARIERGTILVLEGESPLGAGFGFRPSAKPHVVVRSVEDLRAP